MRACLRSLWIVMFALGCTGHPDAREADQGVAELRIDASALLASSVTRVTIEGAGQTAELVSNAMTATFDGTLLVPAGSQSFVARAFSDQTLVGQSAPTPAVVQAGVVTRVVIRILDITPDAPPVFGPIFDSLTYPTTVTAGAPASLALSVVAPVGDPVTYHWSSDCPDATFATPNAATTTWSKPSAGSCTIDIVATSNGFSVTQRFVIVVFPAGASDGAVSVSGLFVTEPVIQLRLAALDCTVGEMSGLTPGDGNASCSATIASPASTTFHLSVLSWGLSTPGTLDVSTNCGGLFGTTDRKPDLLGGPWVPPIAGGVCIFTAHATNGDGQTTTLAAAVLTRAGAALPPAQPPDLSMQINTPTFGCSSGGEQPAQCGTIPAGTPVRIGGFMSWRDGLPGDVTVTDSCMGAQAVSRTFGSFTSTTWTVPNTPGVVCTSTAVATNLQGSTTQRQIQYVIGTP